MAAIPIQDARNIFTKTLVDVYKERPKVYNFLRSFFPSVESSSKEVSIEVQRGSEKIAVDVLRGTEGNRNTFSRSTEKVIIPPYFREYFDATELDLYDRLFGSADGTISDAVFVEFLTSVADKMALLVDKIERAYELQCAQVFDTGIVTLNTGDNIDFKRKAGSLVDNSASTWATGTNNPIAHLEAAGNFLRQIGKAQGGVLNAIMGSSAYTAFLANDTVMKRADIRNFSLDAIREPQRNSVGATLHGSTSAGSYILNIWTYPEFYDNAAGTSTPYVDPKKVIVLPESPRFKTAFAAVPQLLDAENPRVMKGAYIFSDYKDQRKHAHIYDVRSAGIAIPTAVDQIYTMKVLA